LSGLGSRGGGIQIATSGTTEGEKTTKGALSKATIPRDKGEDLIKKVGRLPRGREGGRGSPGVESSYTDKRGQKGREKVEGSGKRKKYRSKQRQGGRKTAGLSPKKVEAEGMASLDRGSRGGR